MSYKLFLDDDAGKPGVEPFRNPPVGEDDWKVAHSSREAIHIIDTYGPPSYISFDHDLGLLEDGTEDKAIRVINYLTDNYYDFEVDYEVHSKNVPGSLNIISKMDSWKRSKDL